MCETDREGGREKEGEREREREREEGGERELADLNDPIADDVGAVVSLLVSGHGLDLCLLHLLTTQTKNTETHTCRILTLITANMTNVKFP